MSPPGRGVSFPTVRTRLQPEQVEGGGGGGEGEGSPGPAGSLESLIFSWEEEGEEGREGKAGPGRAGSLGAPGLIGAA